MIRTLEDYTGPRTGRTYGYANAGPVYRSRGIAGAAAVDILDALTAAPEIAKQLNAAQLAFLIYRANADVNSGNRARVARGMKALRTLQPDIAAAIVQKYGGAPAPVVLTAPRAFVTSAVAPAVVKRSALVSMADVGGFWDWIENAVETVANDVIPGSGKVIHTLVHGVKSAADNAKTGGAANQASKLTGDDIPSDSIPPVPLLPSKGFTTNRTGWNYNVDGIKIAGLNAGTQGGGVYFAGDSRPTLKNWQYYLDHAATLKATDKDFAYNYENAVNSMAAANWLEANRQMLTDLMTASKPFMAFGTVKDGKPTFALAVVDDLNKTNPVVDSFLQAVGSDWTPPLSANKTVPLDKAGNITSPAAAVLPLALGLTALLALK